MTRKTMMTMCACGTTAAATLAGCTVPQRTVASAQRADCPGKIVCPLTGELICADKCPENTSAGRIVAVDTARPSCCAGKK